MFRLDGKVAIITGAGGGFGEGIAKAYIERGARVVVADIRLEAAERVAQELGENARSFDGVDYYAFQVVDDFGGAYHDLLFYNPNNYNVYWHDGDGYLTNAYSTDSIFSGTIAGNKEVEYEDDSWEKVFTGYMNALLNECDDTKASTYVDSSCYYLPKLSEMKRDSFVDATKENQTFLIEEGESLAERKKSKKIDKYDWDYEIYESESYIDEYDMDWKELHIALDLDVTAHGETEHFGEYYCVYLREYEYGWRVAALTKE